MVRKWVMASGLHTALFCILAVVLGFGIYNVTYLLLEALTVEQILAETIGRLAASIGILFLYDRLFGIQSFGIKTAGFCRGLFTGGAMFCLLLVNLLLYLGELSEYPVIKPSGYLMAVVFAEQVSVGIFEEFLFRGLLLNTLLFKMKDRRRKGAVWAVVISSALFGAVHLLNLLETPDLINSTISQAVGAVLIGIFLGVLYLRTENIWVVVFYHALTDLITDWVAIFYDVPQTETFDDTPGQMLISIGMNLVFVLAAAFLARKGKPLRSGKTA